MAVTKDTKVIRDLAKKVAEIAADPSDQNDHLERKPDAVARLSGLPGSHIDSGLSVP